MRTAATLSFVRQPSHQKLLLSDVSLLEAERQADMSEFNPGGLHGANPEEACIHVYRYEHV